MDKSQIVKKTIVGGKKKLDEYDQMNKYILDRRMKVGLLKRQLLEVKEKKLDEQIDTAQIERWTLDKYTETGWMAATVKYRCRKTIQTE